MNEADYRQQEELERERMETTLDALMRVWKAGLRSDALILASECGLTTQFRQLFKKAA